MPTVEENLQLARLVLAAAGIADPPREAASILSLALSRDRAFLIAHPEYEPTDEETRRFENFLHRRAAREPFQYISRIQEFYRLDFEVTPDVLIPRPETEMVVDAALEFLSRRQEPSFCEVGVGSGCISVSILHELPKARGVGLDISPAALAVASRNASRHGVADRLQLFESDVFRELDAGRYDLIASNPPYVPAAQFSGLQDEVRDFEPRAALTDGGDGLSIIAEIIRESPTHLFNGGNLLMEIGFDQSKAVERLFEPSLWNAVDLMPDLQGIPRLVRAVLK